jgi:microsomal dipeptidase-like Zn-dependent dipeptidase
MMKPVQRLVVGLLVMGVVACGSSSVPEGGRDAGGGAAITTSLPVPQGDPTDRYSMANGCYALRARAGGTFLRAGEAVAFDADALADATPFTFKASALGHYLFYSPDGRWLSGGGASPRLVDAPQDGIEWTVAEAGGEVRNGFTVVNRSTQRPLEIGGVSGPFAMVPARGCTPYPEAELNAVGTPFKGTNPDGTVFGYAETHMHLGGSEALGGRLGYGRPFHRYGIIEALDNCAVDHGPNGTLDALDAIVNPNRNFLPPHATQGWPTFRDWPARGSQTHHQTYYLWLKRAWMGGLRFMMNHLVANEVICQIWPLKEHDCDEMASIELQRQLVLELQDYIDAQEGGPGKGFFRIVSDPRTARRVIEDGKMAVVLGTENEKIFGCGEFLDQPECTTEHIDAELDRWYDLGLRAIFPIHLFDNAIGGTRLTDDVALNVVYQGGNILETGHPYATIPCEEADATPPGEAPVASRGIFDFVLAQVTGLPPPVPPLTGCLENARGLTDLGDYFVRGMVDRGIMIETDHAGTLSRKRMLDIAAEKGVGVLSGHTGFVSDARDTRRILQVGGIVSNLPDDPTPMTLDFIQQLAAAHREVFGDTRRFATGLGSDINGIHVQAAPRADAAERPLKYPFTSYDGRVVFERQVTGERVFDLNTDGVAHYGLYPDYLADLRQLPGGEEAMQYLFRSAEAYLQFWERAESRRSSQAK